MSIERVEGWKTSDGKIHTDRGVAQDYEAWLEFKSWCDENICRGGEWSADMVARKIWDRWVITNPQSKL
jgi:hypothetical protein